MKMSTAMKIIKPSVKPMTIGKKDCGFMISFEKHEGHLYKSDYFPDKHANERLIASQEEAWELARMFAQETAFINIYVIDHNFRPVKGYETKKIRSHSPVQA